MNRRKSGCTRLKLLGPGMLCIPFFFCTVAAQRIPPEVPQFPIPPAARQEPVDTSLLKMIVEEGRVTAAILNCPLQNVLTELADRTGIIFEVRSQENPRISIDLKGVPLQEAIRRIASGNNTMFLYSEEAGGREQISMVRIFSRMPELAQPSIVYLGTGKVTKYGDIFETPEQALKILSEGADVRERENAIGVLAAAGLSETVVKALIKAISDPAPEVRAAAIEGLAGMGARSALPAILQCLKDSHPGVRQIAATAVGLLGNSENIKHLKPLAGDRDVSVAAAAESAMRKLAADSTKR